MCGIRSPDMTKRALSIRESETQPYPEAGALFKYTLRETGGKNIDGTVELLRRQIQEVHDCIEDEEGEASGHLFIFEKSIKELQERIGIDIDFRRKEWNEAVIAILGELCVADRFEQTDGVKGHPFESLIVIECLEKALQKKTAEHKLYAIKPLKKLYGTEYASKYEWASGDDLERCTGLHSYDDSWEKWHRDLADVFGSVGILHSDQRAYQLYLHKAEKTLRRLKAYQAKSYEMSDEVAAIVAKSLNMEPAVLKEQRESEAKDLAATLDPTYWEPFCDDHIERIALKQGKNISNTTDDDLEEIEDDLRLYAKKLKILIGYSQLWIDSQDFQWDEIYKKSGICNSGMRQWDLAMRNIIFDTMNSEGIPQFTIIDQWTEDGEENYKRNKHNNGSGTLRMGP